MKFYKAIQNDPNASQSCEIAIVCFNSDVQKFEDFSTIDRKNVTSCDLKANGGTRLAGGVSMALDLLEARKKEYKENGVDYFQPWLVLITDGKPGDPEDLPAVQERTKKLIEEKRLSFWPLAVANDSDQAKYREIIAVLNGFCPRPKAVHLKDLKFEDFFEWLGKSVSAISASKPEESLKLNISNMDEWANI